MSMFSLPSESFRFYQHTSLLDDRVKPITEARINTLWYKLLYKLENILLISSEKLSDGTPLRLVHDYGQDHKGTKTKTDFPLHSLRVSLITCYLMDAKLPLPVVSKLLAGHSRLLMTIYYTKLTPTVMKEKMEEAEKNLDKNSQESVRVFLKDAELRQIENKMAYHDWQSINSALINRNPLGWENRHIGLCLVGGNNSRSDEVRTVAGCWNGGEQTNDSTDVYLRDYAPVGHGPENCVRCRWFITDARYLPVLNAHLNFMSYRAHEAANLAIKLEGEIESLEEIKYCAESEGKPFIKHTELQALQRRHEKQIVEADEYTKDWIATFGLIRRLIEIETGRKDGDERNKFIAVGSEADIKVGFIETESELLNLSLICDDAEIFPDMLDDVKKTGVIQDRTQILTRHMMRKNYVPKLMTFDKDQQLIVANAMIRQMALHTKSENRLDGYMEVVKYLELGEFLEDSQLLDIGIQVLEGKNRDSTSSLSFKSLTIKA